MEWKEYALGELAEYVNGCAFKPQDWGKTGLPIIRIQNLTKVDSPFNFYNGQILDRHLVDNGDLLISWSATLGSFIWNRGPAVLNQHIFKVNPVVSLVEKEFLHYLVLNTLDAIAAHSHGIAMKHITKKKFEAFRVMIPPLTEQRRIVARIKECMERVDEIVELRAQALIERESLLESQIEAMLVEVEGEPVVLGDVSHISSRLIDPRDFQYKELHHVGGANIESKTGVLADLKTAQEEGLRSGKFVFDETMVLYNKIRPYLVKVARPDFQGLCSADMYPLSPDSSRLTRDYLFYLLMSRDFTKYAIAGSNRAGMPKVNRKHLFAYHFKLPLLSRQVRITGLLDEARSAVEKLRAAMEEGSNEVTALRESILRKAFVGEL